MHQTREDHLLVSLDRCLELIDDFKPGAQVALFGQFITLHIMITSNCIGAIGNGVWMRGRSCALSVVVFLFRFPLSDSECIYLLISLNIYKVYKFFLHLLRPRMVVHMTSPTPPLF